MPSQINPNLTNPQYPVAGTNNSSQGFRDNFQADVTNFTAAAREINDLMNKVVVTAPLTYGNVSVSNNLNGQPLSGAVLSDFSFGIANHGTLTSSGSENFDFLAGYVHVVTLGGNPADTIINPINRPGTGYSQLVIQATVSHTNHTLDFSSLSAVNVADGVSGYNPTTKLLTFPSNNVYLLVLGTADGVNWNLAAIGSFATARNYTPSTSIGGPGDTTGMVAYDGSFMYVCTGNYNGSSHIWLRAAVASW
jgi:hypothetical protein